MALTACGSDNPVGASAQAGGNRPAGSGLAGTLSGTGASSQGSAMNAWKAGFSALNHGVNIQYSPDGSGAGRTAMLAGAVQFAGSDAYMKDEELATSVQACGPGGAFDVPVYVSPIAVAYNLPGIKELKLDPATIAGIFRGAIMTWNDPSIAATNRNTELPDLKITAVHRSDDSGTTENFTDYLHAAAPAVWTAEPDGNWPAGLTGENAKGTSGVVSTVSGTKGAITYADDSAVGGDLGTVQVKAGDSYVGISAEAAAKAVAAAKPVPDRPTKDIALALDRTAGTAGVYPIVLVSYHVYCSQYQDAGTAKLVKAFARYVLSPHGQQAAAAAAKSAPLPEPLAAKARASVDSISVK